MFIAIISTLIILYCIVRLLNVKQFIEYLQGEEGKTVDSIFTILILFWLLLNIFLYSGPIVLLVFFYIILSDVKGKKHSKRITRYVKLLLYVLIAVNAFIVFNQLYFKCPMWEYVFEFFGIYIW